MAIIGKISQHSDLNLFGIKDYTNAFCNLSPDELVKASLDRNMATLSDTDALRINTGKFTE